MSHSLIFKMKSREHKTLFTTRAAVQRELILWAESALREALGTHESNRACPESAARPKGAA